MPAEPVYDLERVSGGGWIIRDDYSQVVARYAADEIGAAMAELNRLNAEAEASARDR